MLVKIDLEKVYDKLEWSFIKMVLEHFGFPPNIVKLIMNCVSTTSTTILSMGISWTPSIPLKELGKGIPSPLTYFCCVWSS